MKFSAQFQVLEEQKKLVVDRQFVAPVNRVWDAWTQADLLDQ